MMLDAGTVRPITIYGSTDRNSDPEKEYKKLVSLRARLQMLRKALLDAGDPGAKHLYRCIVRVDKPNLKLIIEPRENEFASLLDSFHPPVGGTAAAPDPSIPPPPVPELPFSTVSDVESMFDRLAEETDDEDDESDGSFEPPIRE
jgi:hypothetical protein